MMKEDGIALGNLQIFMLLIGHTHESSKFFTLSAG
jgi:hypothetical protein